MVERAGDESGINYCGYPEGISRQFGVLEGGGGIFLGFAGRAHSREKSIMSELNSKMEKGKLIKLSVRNMVCQRCIMTVEGILKKLEIPFHKVVLGEIELENKLNNVELRHLEEQLNNVGFELVESRVNKVIEEIKKRVLEYLDLGMDNQGIKLSSFITKKIPYEYSYLSDLFSSIEGTTIEQFFIVQRIEKVKELIVYDELSLTEISYRTGFSSVHHLSSQFKKVTGLTPSAFKKIGAEKRKAIDRL